MRLKGHIMVCKIAKMSIFLPKMKKFGQKRYFESILAKIL